MSIPTAGAIILAAGESRRMGSQKVVLPFGGTTVIGHIVTQIQAGGVRDVIVVTGKNPDAVGEALAPFDVTIVHNDSYTDGMLSSVRAGLSAAPDSWDAACIVLGDQPSVLSDTVSHLFEMFCEDSQNIHQPVYGERAGHPVVIPRRHFGEILTDFDDIGLRGLMRRHASTIRRVEVAAEGILRDMDYPEDYRREIAAFAARNPS